MNIRTRHMNRKTDKRFFFEVQLNWMSGAKGVLSAADADGTVHIAMPPAFGGAGRPWTPEHLFLSAISSCFMTTYLVFAKKHAFEISGFECNTIGRIEVLEGKYKFTQIDLYPKISVADQMLMKKAQLVLEKTQKHCLVTNSVNADIIYHSEVVIDYSSAVANETSP